MKHCAEPVTVSVARSPNALKHGGGHAKPALFINQQFTGSFDHFIFRLEVDDGNAVRPENFPMFGSIFRENTGTHCGEFVGTHGVSVTIGAADKT